MDSSKNTKVFPATLKSIPEIKHYIQQRTSVMDIDRKKEMQILLAVEELIVNIINYAKMEKPEIVIEVDVNSKTLIVKILDYGAPFNPLEVDEPDLSASLTERQIGGLGLFLVRKVVDEVTYERLSNQNCITLKFNL